MDTKKHQNSYDSKSDTSDTENESNNNVTTTNLSSSPTPGFLKPHLPPTITRSPSAPPGPLKKTVSIEEKVKKMFVSKNGKKKSKISTPSSSSDEDGRISSSASNPNLAAILTTRDSYFRRASISSKLGKASHFLSKSSQPSIRKIPSQHQSFDEEAPKIKKEKTEKEPKIIQFSEKKSLNPQHSDSVSQLTVASPKRRVSENDVHENRKRTYSKSQKSKKVKLFGSTLEDILALESKEIPFFVKVCVDYIRKRADSEGIFRISPDHSELNHLSSELEKTSYYNLEELDPGVHLVAAILKKFLRELPSPVLTYEMYSSFITLQGMFQKLEDRGVEIEEELKVRKIIDLLQMLPKSRFHLVTYLLDFLYELSTKSEQNKMTTKNLATIFGPILLSTSELSSQAFFESTVVANLVETLIIWYPAVSKKLDIAKQ